MFIMRQNTGISLALLRRIPMDQLVQLFVLQCLVSIGNVWCGRLSKPDDNCAIYDTCHVRDYFRTCSCDADCSRYDTCCLDAPAKYDYPAEDFECHSDFVPQPVFVKKLCSPNFNGDPGVKDSCELHNPDLSDLMANVLVSSNRTWTTYKNFNCALCNGEAVIDLWFWTVQASYVFPYPFVSERINIKHFRRHFSYNNETMEWGIYDKNKRFTNTPIHFYQPVNLIGQLRYCAGNVTSECPPVWPDDEIKERCHNYYGERKVKNSKLYFRNVHCAVCNGMEISDLECFGRNYKPVFPKGDIATMRVIFNLNPWTGEHMTGQKSCSSNRRYDPFLRVCRSVKCGLKVPTLEESCSDVGSHIVPPILILCLCFFITNLVIH